MGSRQFQAEPARRGSTACFCRRLLLSEGRGAETSERNDEGAHAGIGLGHEFLRHVERTRVLIHLVEPEPVDGTDPIENYRTIRSELEQYGHSLENRREIVAVSKAELPSAAEVQAKLAAASGRDVILFSSVTGQGLDRLLQAAHTALLEARAEEKNV